MLADFMHTIKHVLLQSECCSLPLQGVLFVKLSLYGLFSELIFSCLMRINNNRLMSHFHHFLLSLTSYLFIYYVYVF